MSKLQIEFRKEISFTNQLNHCLLNISENPFLQKIDDIRFQEVCLLCTNTHLQQSLEIVGVID